MWRYIAKVSLLAGKTFRLFLSKVKETTLNLFATIVVVYTLPSIWMSSSSFRFGNRKSSFLKEDDITVLCFLSLFYLKMNRTEPSAMSPTQTLQITHYDYSIKVSFHCKMLFPLCNKVIIKYNGFKRTHLCQTPWTQVETKRKLQFTGPTEVTIVSVHFI